MVHSSIRDALQRLESTLDRKPSFGRSTDRSVATVTSGLRCRIEEGPWHLETDLPKGLGGSATAPTPGVLGRAALGSCLAMGYVLRAARRGVELSSVRVTVEADSHIAGMLLVAADAPPGYAEIRYHVEVESPCGDEQVRQVVDEADRLSPLLDAFGRANTMRRTLTIKAGGG